MSSHHWDQPQKDGKPIQGTVSETKALKYTLFWNQRKNKLTIPIRKTNNVTTFLSASGGKKYGALLEEADLGVEKEQESHAALCLSDQVIRANKDNGYADKQCMKRKFSSEKNQREVKVAMREEYLQQ